MSLDIDKLQNLVNQLATEAAEAKAAGVELEFKNQEAAAAAAALQTATANYTRENDEKLVKMAEIVAELKAAIAEG